MSRPSQLTLWCGAILYALGDGVFRAADTLLGIPSGVEDRHHLNIWKERP